MNFFGSSGHLNLINAETRGPHQQLLVKVKSLNSSEDETESVGSENTSAIKHGSLSRQQKPDQQRRSNRKNNSQFRSVWYDEEEQHDGFPSTHGKPPSLMRKASSLGNLLDMDYQERRPLFTKDMISGPICVRKIKGNWTDKKEKAVDILEEDEIIPVKNDLLLNDKPELDDSKEDEVPVASQSVESIESTVTDSEEHHPPSAPRNVEHLESRITELNTIEPDQVQTILKKAFSFDNLFKFNTIDAKMKRKNSLDAAMSTRSLPRRIDKVIEMQPLMPVSETEIGEIAEEKNVDSTSREIKREPSLDKLKYGPDNKNRRKNISKLDISPPSLPRKIQEDGDVVHMDRVDIRRDDGNLLGMKRMSKSSSELLKSFSQNEKFEHSNDPKFPLSESDEINNEAIEIRKHRNIRQYRYSKTTDFDFRKNQGTNRNFEAKACTKIHIPKESSPKKLKKNEAIRYENGTFYRIDDSTKEVLKSNVILKSARLLNKKDVELKDSNNLTYTLFFDSSKDAKLFLENENVHRYIDGDSKSTITKTLLRLLGKRSSREVLEKKGIYQNEPIFGNTLEDIYRVENGVPLFIIKTLELIEMPENIVSLGLYRTSGNLATIQKIRFEVDKGRLDILNDFCKDVDVLTGALKLFFRELMQPLIPFNICDGLLDVMKNAKQYSKKDRDKIKSILAKLPEANSETLFTLISHLIKVVKYKEENKMDTYNLAVCWGPTIIFMTDSMENFHVKDIVAQSSSATRLFEALLVFYTENPEELFFGKKRQDYLGDKTTIQRQNSKESIGSSDSSRKNGSNLSLSIDDILKKIVEMIEINIRCEGLYTKSGSTEKINRITKKITKKKVSELEKYRSDIHELTESLRRYVRDLPEPLVTKEVVEQVNKYCDNTPCLEQNNRQKIATLVENLPKKDTLIYLTRHIIKVMENEPYHKVPKAEIISTWTNVFNHQKRIIASNESFSNFLRIILDVFDESKPNMSPARNISNGLLNDLKNYQKDKDRCSKYDNVPEHEVDVLKQMTIPEEKTDGPEYTKL